MTLITTERDLDAVRLLPRAFVLIWVNWAIQARHSDVAFGNFAAAWGAVEPDRAIPSFRVDLSLQHGEIWEAMRKWLRDDGQEFNSLTYGGYGALLWLTFGHVAESAPYVAIVEPDKLAAVTRSTFFPSLGIGDENAKSTGW